MSGMDRLTDEDLEKLASDFGPNSNIGDMARELLAHRRASLPPPAPSDGLREENERLRGELDWIGNHMVMSMALNESDLIRAMKARARAALTPAPAQEGTPAMTDPTPTRAEVVRYDPLFSLGEMLQCPDGDYVRFTDYQALRERAEAADQARDQWMLTYHNVRDTLNEDLTEARRGEDAAWNDAIEAAALMANGIYKEAAEYRLPLMAVGASKCRDDIRALRRAAPTEGEA